MKTQITTLMSCFHVLRKLEFSDGMFFNSQNLYYNDDGYKFLYLSGPWKTQTSAQFVLNIVTVRLDSKWQTCTSTISMHDEKVKEFNCNKNTTPQTMGPNSISKKLQF
jgi:hypothetical protein